MNILHEGQRFQKCNACEKSLFNVSNLKRHIFITVHEDQKDYRCDFCGKSFFLAQNLKKYIHTTKITNVNLVVNPFQIQSGQK